MVEDSKSKNTGGWKMNIEFRLEDRPLSLSSTPHPKTPTFLRQYCINAHLQNL